MRAIVPVIAFWTVFQMGGSAPLFAFGAEEGTVVRESINRNRVEILEELMEFLTLPNVSGNLDDILENARHLQKLMERRGIRTQIVDQERAPLVIGHIEFENAQRTLLLYAHYDGQAVDESRWVDSKPFAPILRDGTLEEGRVLELPAGGEILDDWRVFARSASDDKSPIVAMLAALDALEETGQTPTSNLIFVFEGEEEAGSAHLPELLTEYRDLLRADAIIVADGPVFITNAPTVYFGARGIVTLELTVYGPARNLHSGHYGNWVPNPAQRLANLLASMKDDSGRVLVEGFYGDLKPLTPAEEEALESVPGVEARLMEEFAIGSTEGDRTLMRAINLPSLNVRGLRSGWTGEQARTIVPDRATASIDLRVVESIDPARQVERVIEHIRKQGFYVVSSEPATETLRAQPKVALVTSAWGYAAHRTAMGDPLCVTLLEALRSQFGEVVALPTLGGSVPLVVFKEKLGNDLIIGLPIVNPDNNQHSSNENLRLGHFYRGIESFAVLYTMPGLSD